MCNFAWCLKATVKSKWYVKFLPGKLFLFTLFFKNLFPLNEKTKISVLCYLHNGTGCDSSMWLSAHSLFSLFVSLFNLFAHGLTDKSFPWQFLEDADRAS